MIIDKELLLKKLEQTEISVDKYTVSPSKQEGFTVLCKADGAETYINSKYNPVKSGLQFAKSVYRDDEALVVYGLGLGYHIKALHGLLADTQTLYVFEANFEITKIAFEKTDILNILEMDNVIFYCSDNLKEFAVFLEDSVKSSGHLIIYTPSLSVIPSEMSKLGDVLTEYKANDNMLQVFSAKMEENSAFNIAAGYRNGLKLFKGAFPKMPAIVVAAGASLNLNVAGLVNCRDKALIVCVTRASKTLQNAGVVPDFYVVTDARAGSNPIYEDYETPPPLFLLSTADIRTSAYKGEKLIIYESGDSQEGERDFYVETGGSVATAAVSICAKFGADPIVFIGQDLCYCFATSHADGKGFQRTPLKASRTVLANDGNKYFTSGGLYIYLRWFERFIKRNMNIKFYNATALGAVIEGAPNIDLSELFSKYPNIREDIEKIKSSRGLG